MAKKVSGNKIDKNDLMKALTAVKPGLSNKEIVIQSTSFVFKDGYVITYNDDIAMINPVTITDEFAIQADLFLNFLSKVKDEQITLTVENKELKINGKKFKAGISIEDVDMPLDNLDNIEEDDWTDLPEHFLHYAKMAAMVCGKDLDRPLFHNVHMNYGVVEGCDNNRMTICDFKDNYFNNILTPADSILKLCNYNVTQYFASDSWLSFRTEDGLIFSCRLYDEDYPELQEIIDSKTNEEEPFVIELPSELDDVLPRAYFFSKSGKDDIETIALKFENDILKVKGKNESGWFSEEIIMDYEYTKLMFNINPLFLKSVMKTTTTVQFYDEEQCISFEDDLAKHIILLADS